MKAWISRRIGKANINSVKVVDTPFFGAGSALLEVTQPITVWKRVRVRRPPSEWLGPPSRRTIQLTLMPGALVVVHSYDTKSRANFAVVQEHDQKLYSGWNHTFLYRSDRCVKPRHPFSLTSATCASGIHFFFNKRAADGYNA